MFIFDYIWEKPAPTKAWRCHSMGFCEGNGSNKGLVPSLQGPRETTRIYLAVNKWTIFVTALLILKGKN